VRVTLEIQRLGGVDERRVDPGEIFGIAEGLCPGCGTTPFRVQGLGLEGDAEHGYRAGGVSVCCQQNVGWIYAVPETLFGSEEDRAVLSFGRARVYGGGIRP